MLGICYNPAPTDPAGPRGDVISGNHIVGYGTGIQMAASAPYNVIRGNTLAVATTGVENLNDTNIVEGNTTVRLR